MVTIINKRMRKCGAYFLIFLSILIFFTTISYGGGEEVRYRVDKEWVHIWINKDGSIHILYNITLTYTAGSPEGIILVGMPKEDFQIQYVQDIENRGLNYELAPYGIEVELTGPINLNQPNTIIIDAIVSGMIYEDETNPGNVGLKFYPSTFEGAEGSATDIRVIITLPEGVEENEIKYLEGKPFNNVFRDEENLVAVYWEEKNWVAYENFWVGVSFPEKYVNLGPDIWHYITIGGSVAIFLVMVIIAAFAAIKVFRKAAYEKPRIAIETLGPARGLTSVEAAVVLELKPIRVLTMVLFGLLLKRVLMVIATEPIIKLRRLEMSNSEPVNLRYYEIDFLNALRSDGSLDDILLAKTYLNLRETVNLKLRGFSRIDTINYYKAIVDRAWQQVTQAGTPHLKCDALEENVEWLLADDRFEEKLKVAFPPDIIIYPRPDWWWYWHGPHLPHSQPPIQTDWGEVKPVPIPGQEFANNVVLALEKAANNIVKNVQDFANRLVPSPEPPISHKPLRYPSCACACASCACACACVSCACACAHGGAR